MNRGDQACELMMQGFGCSQAVLSVYCKGLGLDSDTALKIAAPFRAGMGRMGHTCGAVTGALMVLGLKYSGISPDDAENRDRVCTLVQEFTQEFCRKNKTIVCNDLVGCDISVPEQRQAAAEKGVFTTLCPGFVRDAVEIVGQMIETA